MEIAYRTKKLQRICNSEKELIKKYGSENARKIGLRLDALLAAESLGDVYKLPHLRCHKLKGKRKDQYAASVKQPYRLIFRLGDDTPRKEDGSVDADKARSIVIVDVEDYHGS